MKIILLLLCFIAVTSITFAETYKWEDSKGVHYSDNPASVPNQYRVEINDQVNETVKPAPPVNLPNQFNSTQYQNSFNNNNQASIEQAKAAQDEYKRKYAVSSAESQKRAIISQQKAMEQLSKYILFLLIIGGLLLLDWIWALIDILKNEFSNPTNKVVWLLLVMMIPILGVILYRLIGKSQTVNYISSTNRERSELLARLYPKRSKSGNFDIR